MSEIKDFSDALIGCMDPKTMHPAKYLCTFPYMRILTVQKRHAFPGAWAYKSMHPRVKSCTSGAGCILNSGHCQEWFYLENKTHTLIMNTSESKEEHDYKGLFGFFKVT